MSLRARLLVLFLLLATLPWLALGTFQYRQSRRAVEELIATRVATLAGRAAAEIEDRWAQRESELLLLAENTETQAAFRERAVGPPGAPAALATDAAGSTGAAEPAPGSNGARGVEAAPGADATPALAGSEAQARARAFLSEAWRAFGHHYFDVELRDTVSSIRFALQGPEAPAPVGAPPIPMDMPLRDPDSGARLGTVAARVRPDALFPREALEAGFGESGSSLVVDRLSGRILWHRSRSLRQQPIDAVLLPEEASPLVQAASGRGVLTFGHADSARVGAFVRLERPAWTVLASAAVAEFAEPMSRARTMTLLLVLAGTGLITAGFVLLLRRYTGSLVQLTSAADQVGAGRFELDLPAAGDDEVGRLSTAFATMAERIRDMVRQIERSRQLAAVGEFAAKLTHEIRNPLTSLKLNLQGLERDLTAREAPEEIRRQIDISLREIARLDRVAHGVLDLARPPGTAIETCSVHQAIEDALAVVRPQLDAAGALVETELGARDDSLRADPEELEGVFLNLFLNAAEAMPDGGQLRVATSNAASAIQVAVSDTGPGVSPELCERIFDPFFSTKRAGSGLGLSVALQRIEALGGTLRLADEGPTTGARFVVELPQSVPESRAEQMEEDEEGS